MQEASEDFVIELLDNISPHAKWLEVARFGMAGLLEHPLLLAEVIGREASRMVRTGPKSRVVSDEIVVILQELGLRITTAEASSPIKAGAGGEEDVDR